MEKVKNESGNFWPFLAAATVLIIIVAAICWSLNHPYGIHWDEAQYLDDVGIDVQRLQTGHLLKLGWRILIGSWGRPPAFRLLALPFVALFGFHATVTRLASLAWFGLSAWFVYLSARRIASPAAGGFAVLIFALSPEVISASIFFSTDAPLYLATSAMLFYLFASWSDTSGGHSRTWIGLGLAIGLGFLSKASFAAIVLPVLAFWFVVSRWGNLGIPSPASQRKAGALAFLVAAPWWILNFKAAVDMLHQGRSFVRDSLGQPSVATWIRWFSTVFQGLLGYGIGILIGLVLIRCLMEVSVRRLTLDSFQKVALGACACAGLPIAFAQLSGTNHLLRHISPAVIPLAIAVGVLSDKTGWTHSAAAKVVSASLFCVQLLMILTPIASPNEHAVDIGFVNTALPWRVMSRFDQWDWKPIREISYSCGVANPKISFLGSGRAFDPPQIEYPWVVSDERTKDVKLDLPTVTWLWRYEEGPLDWQRLMDLAEQSDIVLTAPSYAGEERNKEDLDNQYNAEFADRLSRDPDFRAPIRLQMGRFEPVEVQLFLKKALTCQPNLETTAKK